MAMAAYLFSNVRLKTLNSKSPESGEARIYQAFENKYAAIAIPEEQV